MLGRLTRRENENGSENENGNENAWLRLKMMRRVGAKGTEIGTVIGTVIGTENVLLRAKMVA